MKLELVLPAVATSLLLFTSPAAASLTSSEVGQVKDFVARGQLANVTRVRALVVRTDLSPDESINIVVDALSAVSFEEKRPEFVKDLLFGGGGSSLASRPLLALAVTKGLLARANIVHQRYAGGLDHEPRAVSELLAIYSFLDTEIANAGKPTATEHDASAGIPAATLEKCTRAIAEHLEQNARVLKGAGKIDEAVGRVRAQAQIALIDMTPDGTTRHVDAAKELGIDGDRRQMLVDWGIFVADAGHTDPERVKIVLAKLPGARQGISVIYTGKDRGELHARQGVAYAGMEGERAFDEGAPTEAAGLVQDLAVIAAKRALETSPALLAQVEKDVVAARGDHDKTFGHPRAPSLDHYLGAAMTLAIWDGQRAVDLAFGRFLAGRPESAALLVDALVAVGDPKLDTFTKITTDSFTHDGHVWSVQRGGPAGIVVAVKRDGQNVTLAQLPTAKIPLKDGESWTDGTATFTRMRGTPKASIVPHEGKGSTLTVAGQGAKGFDAIVMTNPPASFVLEGDLMVRGAQGGIAIRTSNGKDAVKGLMLLVTPGGKAALVTSDDAGAESMQGAGIDPAPPMPCPSIGPCEHYR